MVGSIFILITLILYTYFLYPIFIAIINKVKKGEEKSINIKYFPAVTLIIAAHNEENVIAAKIGNSLQLDYPKENLEIIVAADGCTDKTIEIVKSFENNQIKLSEQKEHLGKTCAVNKAVEMATGEFIIFSDANGLYQPDAIKKLIRHFRDKKIGSVCGNLILQNPESKAVGEGEGLYWKYEKWIKEQESDFASLIGANGSIFAIRKNLYTPLDSDIIDDFTTPLLIRRRGYKVVYEPAAKSIEEANESTKQGFWRKVRIILRQLVALKRYSKIIKPFYGIMGFQLISHKFLRWIVPFWQIGILICTFFILENIFGKILLLAQIIFYLSAVIGFILEKNGKSSGKLRIPFYFCMMNLAAFIAILKFLAGKTQPKWKVAR